VDFKLADGSLVAPGAKIISLNTNVANTENWSLLGERNDPAHHLEWLE